LEYSSGDHAYLSEGRIGSGKRGGGDREVLLGRRTAWRARRLSWGQAVFWSLLRTGAWFFESPPAEVNHTDRKIEEGDLREALYKTR